MEKREERSGDGVISSCLAQDEVYKEQSSPTQPKQPLANKASVTIALKGLPSGFCKEDDLTLPFATADSPHLTSQTVSSSAADYAQFISHVEKYGVIAIKLDPSKSALIVPEGDRLPAVCLNRRTRTTDGSEEVNSDAKVDASATVDAVPFMDVEDRNTAAIASAKAALASILREGASILASITPSSSIPSNSDLLKAGHANESPGSCKVVLLLNVLSKPQGPLTEFLLFPKLPIELRHEIWRLAALDAWEDAKIHAISGFHKQYLKSCPFLNKPGHSNVSGCPPSRGHLLPHLFNLPDYPEYDIPLQDRVFLSQQPIDGILHACYESRLIAIWRLKLKFFFGTYINFAKDIIFFDGSETCSSTEIHNSGTLSLWAALSIDELKPLIKRVAISPMAAEGASGGEEYYVDELLRLTEEGFPNLDDVLIVWRDRRNLVPTSDWWMRSRSVYFVNDNDRFYQCDVPPTKPLCKTWAHAMEDPDSQPYVRQNPNSKEPNFYSVISCHGPIQYVRNQDDGMDTDIIKGYATMW